MAVDVKICGIKDVATAEQSVRAGADYLGLVLAPSKRRVSLMQAREITGALPDVKFVAVVRDMAEPELACVLSQKGFWAVQFHGAAGYDWMAMVHQAGLHAIATQINDQADVILLDGPEPGQGQSWDWHLPLIHKPVWIAGGLSPENVGDVVARLHPSGVDVSSGVETLGTKNLDKIIKFIREAKQWQS